MASLGLNAGFSLAGNLLGVRVDPYQAFKFVIEIEGILTGGFSECSGLQVETEFHDYREGGVNDYEHKLATLTTYGNLVLERGMTDDYLLSWHQDVVDGIVKRRTVTIIVNDETGARETLRWLVQDAYPVKWTGTDLDAASGGVLAESVELTHQGFRRA